MDGAPTTEFPVVVTHRGRYLQYNIFNNLFEITSKYQPPIMPIGRGAYGIVWYPISLTHNFLVNSCSFYFFPSKTYNWKIIDSFWWTWIGYYEAKYLWSNLDRFAMWSGNCVDFDFFFFFLLDVCFVVRWWIRRQERWLQSRRSPTHLIITWMQSGLLGKSSSWDIWTMRTYVIAAPTFLDLLVLHNHWFAFPDCRFYQHVVICKELCHADCVPKYAIVFLKHKVYVFPFFLG